MVMVMFNDEGGGRGEEGVTLAILSRFFYLFQRRICLDNSLVRGESNFVASWPL